MKSSRLLRVSVGIAAYNEEQSISTLLRAVLSQRLRGVRISEIIVISDGSTDATVPLARAHRDRRIRVIDSRQRKGKSYRLNQIFQQAKGDILVLFDADVVPHSRDTIQHICTPFTKPTFRGVASGQRHATTPTSLTGTALYHLHNAYGIVRNELHNGISIFNFFASVTAMHKDFYRTFRFPKSCSVDDNYLYLTAKQRSVPLAFVPKAGVWFTTPQTAKDQISQGSRWLAGSIILEQYFPKQLIATEFAIPLRLRIRMLWYQLCQHPIAYIWLKYLALRCTMNKHSIAKTLGGTWDMVGSTRRVTI